MGRAMDNGGCPPQQRQARRRPQNLSSALALAPTLAPTLASALTLALALIAPLPLQAQEIATTAPPGLSLELNGAADTASGACRFTFVAANLSDRALSQAAYEIGLFDPQGAVSRLLILDMGDLPQGKTKILQFDLDQSPCAQISRIVINEATACTEAATGAALPLCLAGLETSSRTAIQFGL